MESNNNEKLSCDIAVIGMACRFPGAKTVEEFWENLKSGKETIHTFSDDELEHAGVDEQLIHDSNYIKRRGLLEDVEYFDPNFFGISPYEASITDPQQRVFLEICWEALERAGYSENRSEIVAGVFAGAGDNTYLANFLKKNNDFLKNHLFYQANLLNSSHFLTTRVSYLLNLKGPSISVGTGCSTSLVAIIQACQSLSLYDCDIALAGGVTVRVPQTCGYMYQEGAIYSRDGKCRAFDAKASGTVPSNGAGVVVLKRLADALQDGDNIEAVIKSYAINNDGAAKAGYTSPSVLEQTRCIATALSGIKSAENIVYVEAHGTGTILGDPIEVTALSKAFNFYTQKKNFCAIGSVKTNIGHTDVAAGVAGFIKSVLVLKNRAIPVSLNFDKPNPHISFANSPFYVCNQYKSLNHVTTPLCASVSAIGIGGTNAHVVLGEAPQLQTTSSSKPSHLVLLSAKTPSALIQQSNDLLNYLTQQNINNESLADIAYTFQIGKSKFEYRKALICSDAEHLKHLLQIQFDRNVLTNKDSPASKHKIAFLFQGQGTLYEGCVRDVYYHLPTFKIYFDECCNYLKPAVRRMVLDHAVNLHNTFDEDCKNPILQQITMFIIEYSLAKTYIKYGVKPDVLLGHSLGEYTAACIAGIISLEDIINLVCLRAELTSKLPQGLMLSVPISADNVNEYIKEANIAIAAINSPSSCVISGPVAAVSKLQSVFDGMLVQDNQKCTVLKIPYAFHSEAIGEILNEYSQALNTLTFHAPAIPIMTTVDGELLEYEQIKFKNHFKEHFRNPVLFSQCIEELIKDNFTVFLEIGMGHALSILVKQHQDSLITISSLPSEKDFVKNGVNQYAYFNRALGECWINFIDVDWVAYYGDEKRRCLPLPTYPFEKKYCWTNPSNDVTDNKGPFIYESYWEVSSLIDQKTFHKKETWLIFADNFGVADQLIDKLMAHKQIVICVKIGDCFKQINDNCYKINPIKKSDYEQLVEVLTQQKQSLDQVVHLWSISGNDSKDSGEPSKRILEDSFFSLVSFFQVLSGFNQLKASYLTVVTNHLKAIYSEDNVIPEKSTMLGFCLVLPQETSTLARVIDTDILKLSSVQQNKVINSILNETAAHPTNSIVVYRDGLRLVNRFREHEKTTTSESDANYLRQHGVYIIVGGLGKLGLELADFLANTYKAHLILISRNISVIEKSIENKISVLKKTAASLLILQADVSNYLQMKEAFAIIKADFPKVDGVFHLAAVLDFSTRTLIKDLYLDQAYEQFKPKIEGTKILNQLIPEVSPRFCVAFSSLSAIIGGSELCSYAASNCSLDSMVDSYQNNAHTHWISINWDAWMRKEGSNVNRDALSFAQGFKLLQICLQTAKNKRLIVSIKDLNLQIKEWVNYKETKTTAYLPPDSTKSNNNTNIDVELVLKQLFGDCLGVKHVDVKDDFYDLGGDSLSLLRLYEMINQVIPGKLKLVDLIRNRSVYELSNLLKNKSKSDWSSCLVKIKSTGNKQPLFLIHPVGGTVFCYIELAKYLSIDHPLIAIQDPLLESEQVPFVSIEEMAQHYLQAIKSVQNDGHYLIGGYSFGANVAFEIVKQLEQEGKTASLFIIDGWARYSEQLRDREGNVDTMAQIVEETNNKLPGFIHNKEKFIDLLWKRMELLFKHHPKKIKSEAILFKAREVLPEYAAVDEAANHWQNCLTKPIATYTIDGNHMTILKNASVKQIAEVLNKYLTV
ncbi:MAG: hypothetical protein ACD_21C00260G0004 [uncultured bacterium]|nr:MAG: hypothetical protein ACD_21C00260G0004 [uncultured bacterium]